MWRNVRQKHWGIILNFQSCTCWTISSIICYHCIFKSLTIIDVSEHSDYLKYWQGTFLKCTSTNCCGTIIKTITIYNHSTQSLWETVKKCLNSEGILFVCWLCEYLSTCLSCGIHFPFPGFSQQFCAVWWWIFH